MNELLNEKATDEEVRLCAEAMRLFEEGCENEERNNEQWQLIAEAAQR